MANNYRKTVGRASGTYGSRSHQSRHGLVAPVSEVQGQLDTLGLRLQALCLQAACSGGDLAAVQDEINGVVREMGDLRFKREEILRDTFCR